MPSLAGLRFGYPKQFCLEITRLPWKTQIDIIKELKYFIRMHVQNSGRQYTCVNNENYSPAKEWENLSHNSRSSTTLDQLTMEFSWEELHDPKIRATCHLYATDGNFRYFCFIIMPHYCMWFQSSDLGNSAQSTALNTWRLCTNQTWMFFHC